MMKEIHCEMQAYFTRLPGPYILRLCYLRTGVERPYRDKKFRFLYVHLYDDVNQMLNLKVL